jgi:hypothetical protein
MNRLVDDDATDFERMLLGSTALDVPPEGAEAALLDRLDGAPVVAIATTSKTVRTSRYVFFLAAALGVFLIVFARKRHQDGVVPIVQEEPRPTPVSSVLPAREMPLPALVAQEFDRGAAARALGQVDVDECRRFDGPSGSGHVVVVFAPEGNVQHASVDPPFAGTARGACVAAKFAAARVPPFQGAPVRVGKSFVVP